MKLNKLKDTKLVKHLIERNDAKYFYDLIIPFKALMNRKPIYLIASMIVYPVARVVGKLFPKQSNLFAFAIKKQKLQKALFPWLKVEGEKIGLNMRWIKGRYETGREH